MEASDTAATRPRSRTAGSPGAGQQLTASRSSAASIFQSGPRVLHHGAPGASVLLRGLLIVIPVVLAGYALDDRGFAYLASVPGTPLFAGELLLLGGGLFVAMATGYLRTALRHSLPMVLLLAFIGWGLCRTIPQVPAYGLDSIRDAALWYYGLMAVLVATLVVAAPDLPHRWAGGYLPLIIVLLLWAPLSLLLAASGSPALPGSGVPLFSHKPGNTAVTAVIAVAFLWLVPTPQLDHRLRTALTALGTVVILAVGTQNRGGLVAGLAGVIVLALLLGRRSSRMAGVMATTVFVGFVLGWGLDIHLPGGEGRTYSVAQLIDNSASISQGQSSANLGGTVAFRDQLWAGAIDLASQQGGLATGLGFGPNIAQQLGVSTGAADPLRSPHNSHVDVLARMGVVGGVLWLTFWLSWFGVTAQRLRRGAAVTLSPQQRGLVGVCMVGAAAILVNAYFDPTLESPQVAIWLWSLVGLAIGITARSHVVRRRPVVVGGRP